MYVHIYIYYFFLFIFGFQQIEYDVLWCSVLPISSSWVCLSCSFRLIQKCWPLYFQVFFSVLLLLFGNNYSCLRLLSIVWWLSDALFLFSLFFLSISVISNSSYCYVFNSIKIFFCSVQVMLIWSSIILFSFITFFVFRNSVSKFLIGCQTFWVLYFWMLDILRSFNYFLSFWVVNLSSLESVWFFPGFILSSETVFSLWLI